MIGATSSDDGYNLTMARVAGDAGYVANYYRYFGATEAPFDWYQSVLAQLAAVSTAGVWMRLPATLAAIGTWLIISRYMLRRLGPGRGGLAGNRVAVWTAGAVFLAAWLPFNNGLRPEPLIALGVVRHLGACRDGDRHPPAGARGGGDHRRDADRDPGAAGIDRRRRPAGRRAADRADHRAAQGN